MANKTLKYPFGVAPAAIALTATGTQAVTIVNALTFIDGVTVEATGNLTLDLTIGSEVPTGAILHIASKTNGSETLTFGTGITDVTNTGSAGKTFAGAYIYNGTTFYPMGEFQEVD